MFYHKEITQTIINAAFEVHTVLGPGLLESTYEACLYYELNKAGLLVHRQMPLPVVYKEVELDIGYRIDLLVENKVVIDVKSVESIPDIHIAKLLTYLKLSGQKVGLLLNFNVSRMKDGIKRYVM